MTEAFLDAVRRRRAPEDAEAAGLPDFGVFNLAPAPNLSGTLEQVRPALGPLKGVMVDRHRSGVYLTFNHQISVFASPQRRKIVGFVPIVDAPKRTIEDFDCEPAPSEVAEKILRLWDRDIPAMVDALILDV